MPIEFPPASMRSPAAFSSSFFMDPILASSAKFKSSVLMGNSHSDLVSITGPILPAWLTHAFDYSDGGYIDDDPISSTTDSVAGMVASSTLTARPTYRADYLSTGVAAAEFDGVNDFQETATNADLTGGYTYCALVHVTAVRNFVLFFDSGATAQLYSAINASLTLRNWGAPGVSILTPASILTAGGWVLVTAIQNGASSEIYFNRTLVQSGNVRLPDAAGKITLGWNRNAFFTGRMFGAIAAHYFGPPSTPTQRTELWDYINAKHGVVL